jgi:hypothetical protein
MVKLKVVDISKLTLDKKYYPRIQVNWLTVVDYKESMQQGVKFPPIVVARWDGKNIFIDGFHRVEAQRQLKIPIIQAEFIKVSSEADLFKEAVKRNISHGRVLSPYEKRIIILRAFNEFKLDRLEIEDMIHIRSEKFELFLGKSAKNIFSGQLMGEGSLSGQEVIFKAPISEGLENDPISMGDLLNIAPGMEDFYGNSQKTMVKNLLFLVDQKLLTLSDQEMLDMITKLRDGLSELLQGNCG